MDFLSEFQQKMLDNGFTPKGGKVIADDKWHQASYTTDQKGWFSGAYTMKIVDADFAIGCFFTRKDPDTKIKWHSASKEKKFTPAERKRIKRELEEQQRTKEIEEEKRYAKISTRLTRVFKRLPAATSHPYLEKKKIQAHGLRLRKKGNELIMPLYGTDGKLWTLQRITPEGAKYLFTGGKKRGSYYPLASAKDDLSLLIISEGFATGASIREATGKPVIAAIDSGNIKPVLVALKNKYPNSKFIIGADNDAFTLNAKKEPWNVGHEKANEAAGAIGGAYVALPDFGFLAPELYAQSKPTDFNDLCNLSADGPSRVRDCFSKIISTIPVREEAPGAAEPTTAPNQHSAGGTFSDDPPPAEPPPPEVPYQEPKDGDFGMQYKVLGYNNGNYYYFPFKERQIVALSAASHSMPNLFRLDNLESWRNKFGGEETSEKKIVLYATNALMELAKHRGVFKEEDKVRGCGAWIDDGRKILHCGDTLYVDGEKTAFDQLESEFTYVAASKLLRPHSASLTDKEAFALRSICEDVTWENKLSGLLLAGWIVIAPVCGALEFRPHIYITGEAESGKSTVLDKITKVALGRISINVDGGTTEPAIREAMSYDARPVVYDEAEKSIHMPAVIELARKASSGANVKKFGQGLMKVRSCFCFSAINPPVDKKADESRMAFLVLKKNRRPTARQEYEALLDKINIHLTPDFSNKLVMRTLQNLDTLYKNIATFQKAARIVINGARASQVIGALIGGAFLLSSTEVVTLEFAEKWIRAREKEWSKYTNAGDESDPVRLLQYISSCLLKYVSHNATKEMSIGDLIALSHSSNDSNADRVLRNIGIAVKAGRVYIASRNQHLARLLRNTDWDIKWCGMLENIEGAEKFSIFYFGVGNKTSGVSIPISEFIEEAPKDEVNEMSNDLMREIPF